MARKNCVNVFKTKVVVTDQHYLQVPLDRIVKVLRQCLASVPGYGEKQQQQLGELVKMVDILNRHSYADMRQRLLADFQPFMVGAQKGKLQLTPDEGQQLLQQLDQVEHNFLERLFELLDTAHFQVLTAAEMEAASADDFQLVFPVSVNLSAMDPSLPTRFWESRPDATADVSDVCRHMLVFHRGIDEASLIHSDTMGKVELLLSYVLLQPLTSFIAACFMWLHALLGWVFLKTTAERMLDTLPPDIKEEDPDSNLGNLSTFRKSKSIRRSLGGRLRLVFERHSLRNSFPTAMSCIKGLFAKTELREPMFRDVIVMYRRKVKLSPDDKEKMSELQQCYQALAERNLCIKRFRDIPLADLEMVFPDWTIGLQPSTKLSIIGTLLGGLTAVVAGFDMNKLNVQMLVSIVTGIFGAYTSVVSTAEAERDKVQREMNRQVYEKHVASQDCVLVLTMNEMMEQMTKECVLLYFTLLTAGQAMKLEDAAEEAEELIKEEFNEHISLDQERVLEQLLLNRIVTKDGDLLRAVRLSDALVNLDDRWDNLYNFHPDTPQVSVKDLQIDTETVSSWQSSAAGPPSSAVGPPSKDEVGVSSVQGTGLRNRSALSTSPVCSTEE